MKEFIIKIIYSLLIILFLINFSILSFHVAMIMATVFIALFFDFQILLFLLLFIILVACFILLLITKLQNKTKIPLLLLILFLQIIFFKYSFFIPSVNHIIHINYCIDKGNVWNDIHNKCEVK